MPEPTAARAIGLAEAADRLDVHYQTAYKWVRNGTLPAVQVGRTYEIDPDDVATLTDRRARPAPPPPKRPRIGAAADRMHDALVCGNDSEARSMARELVDQGVRATQIADDLLAPALRRIGEGWERGEVSVSVEHRATAIAERILADMTPTPRGRRRGTVLVASVSGDRHGLASLLAATALREDNWRVEHLGADVPPEEIERFSDEAGVDLHVLSVGIDTARPVADTLAERLRDQGKRVLVNEPGATLEDLREQAMNKSH